MHQIVQLVGLRPRPHWGSSQRSPDPLAGKGGGEKRGKGSEGEGREGEGVGKEGKGREERLPPLKFKSGYIRPCLPYGG